MKLNAPLITLGAGLLVAVTLYTANVRLGNEVSRNKTAAAPAPASVAPSSPPAAPASSAPPPSTAPQGTVTYAGAVDGGAASLGIVVNNGRAIAYVCDGRAAEAWLDGPMADGRAELRSAKGSLTATYANDQVKGTVTAGSKTWTFTIKVAAPPSGLYRSAAALRKKLDASWIVLPDGRQVGVASTGGNPTPAPSFDVGARTVAVDGTAVPIEAATPGTGY